MTHQPPGTGATLGPYELGELIGSGATSRVYAATDRKGRALAVKVLRQPRDMASEPHQRLAREAEILSSLSHPGLVEVHELVEAPGGYACLVMERVKGEALDQRLERDGLLTPAAAWRLVRGAAEALCVAHEAGVLHRDVKPANLLVEGDGVRVTDFGLALREADPRLTRQGETTGTPAYMAPEQWWGAEVDARTDVYGLGAVLYQCLAGQTPWHGEDPGELLHRVATAEPAPLSDHNADVSPAVEAFVAACLAREAAARPADLSAFIGQGDAAFGFRPPRRLAEPLVITAAVLGVSMVAGYGGRPDPTYWMYESGAGGYLLPLVFAAAVWLLRFPPGRLVAPFLPLVAGALTTATSFGATMASVGKTSAEARFELFHAGLAESCSGLYMGAFFSAALCAWLATRDPRDARPRWHTLALSAVALGTAALAWDPVAVAAGALAAVLLLRQAPARSPGHLGAALGAVLALGVAAWARHAGDTARLWTAELTRAERASALTTASLHDVSLGGALVCVVLVIIVAGCWRRLAIVPRRTLAVLAVMVALTLTSLAAPWMVMSSQRRALWDELATRFTLWRELDPPRGHGRALARVGPTLQLGRRSLALDSAVVAPIKVLQGKGRTGPLLVAGRLGPVLELDRQPQLVLAADRTLPWAVVSRALEAAAELGVERVDLVFLPGPAPALSPRAPPEASFVLPRDLRVVEVKLTRKGPAAHPRPKETYGGVATRLAKMKKPHLQL